MTTVRQKPKPYGILLPPSSEKTVKLYRNTKKEDRVDHKKKTEQPATQAVSALVKKFKATGQYNI